MRRCASLVTLVLSGALALAPAASAQAQEGAIVDRLVAIVGDSSVVMTQIEEEIQRLGLQGVEVPARGTPDYETMFRGVLDQFVSQLLVLQAADADSLIQVDDATIDQRVADQIEQLTREFGGQAALRQALAGEGLTLAEYREMMRGQAKNAQIQQLYFQSRLRDAEPIDVTEEEMLAEFQDARANLQQRPKLVTFRQLVIRPTATEAAWDSARAEAEGLLERVAAGEDFAELATEYSDDTGSAELGGDLGWFRRGRMVREFEDAAFALFDGQVSPVVRTDYGYHIIKVERSRAGERQARHILIMPEIGDSDLESARERAEGVAEALRSGADIEELLAQHADALDPAAPDSLTVTFDQISEMGPSFAPLRTASAEDVLGPLETAVASGDQRFAVVRVDEVREAGAYTFEDLRGAIASRLQQEKQIERIIEQLRGRTHIEIRM